MDPEIRKEKLALRAAFLSRRRALERKQVELWSESATQRLLSLAEVRNAAAFLVYLSSKDNELSTRSLVEWLLANARVVLVPVALGKGALVWSRIESFDDVAPGTFGILEPKPEFLHLTEPATDAIAVVPGIVFTRKGARIGYGGGYYDRFLTGFSGPKVGLAYEMQLADTIPLEAHDAAVDIVVTEAAIYRATQ